MDELTIAKTDLFASLGDNFKGYLNLLKEWFRGLLDKDSFDYKASLILRREQFRLHNRFLISLLHKCQSLSANKSATTSVSVKTKNKKRIRLEKVCYDHQFRPASPSEYIYPIQSAISDSKDVSETKYYDSVVNMHLCAGDYSTPDNFETHLRMFVGVWEYGLNQIDDEAAHLLTSAVRVFLKNIITSVIAFKSSFRTQNGGRFKHCFGTPVVDPLLTNSNVINRYPADYCKTHVDERTGEPVPDVIPDKEVIEQQAMFQVACGSCWQERDFDGDINLWHLFHAMQKYSHCLPSHTIYSVNMNRIMNNLFHETDF